MVLGGRSLPVRPLREVLLVRAVLRSFCYTLRWGFRGFEPEVFALDFDDGLQTAVVLPSSRLEDLGLAPFTINFTPHVHYLANSGMCPHCLQDRWHYIISAF